MVSQEGDALSALEQERQSVLRESLGGRYVCLGGFCKHV